MMTQNVLAAIEEREFHDPAWVHRILHHFADYYFVALEAYERDPATAPPVWQLAFNATRDPGPLALQKLLLGVNAHINYDLVLTLVDLLEAEWPGLDESQRSERYLDHCRINEVIGRTIDAVQDQVLEPAMPVMDIVDRLLGRLDEYMLTRLIAHWRDTVWQHTVRLLETGDPDERARLIQRVEAETLRHARAIGLTDWRAALDELL
jgi:hypothetical protein